jgi:hypothetical protein
MGKRITPQALDALEALCSAGNEQTETRDAGGALWVRAPEKLELVKRTALARSLTSSAIDYTFTQTDLTSV